jgi:hypothetical protein
MYDLSGIRTRNPSNKASADLAFDLAATGIGNENITNVYFRVKHEANMITLPYLTLAQ